MNDKLNIYIHVNAKYLFTPHAIKCKIFVHTICHYTKISHYYKEYWNLYCYAGYGDLQISGSSSSGRLEFRQMDSTWGVVCYENFSNNAALVACRQLGYDKGSYDSTK